MTVQLISESWGVYSCDLFIHFLYTTIALHKDRLIRPKRIRCHHIFDLRDVPYKAQYMSSIYTTHAGVVMFYTSGQATWEIVPSLFFRFTWDCSVPWKFEMAWKLCLSTCRRQYHPLKRDNHILHVSNHCL